MLEITDINFWRYVFPYSVQYMVRRYGVSKDDSLFSPIYNI